MPILKNWYFASNMLFGVCSLIWELQDRHHSILWPILGQNVVQRYILAQIFKITLFENLGKN